MAQELKTIQSLADELEKQGLTPDNAVILKLRELAKEENEVIAAATYLELSDTQIAGIVKKVSKRMNNTKVPGWEGIVTMAAAYSLLNATLQSNAGSLKLDLNNYTYKGEPQGDWEIVVRQKKSKQIKIK